MAQVLSPPPAIEKDLASPARSQFKVSSSSAAKRLIKEALRISELIDEELRKESSRVKDAKKREVRVMLLGQAESGKSTLQKQFQLLYASRSLDVERLSWIPAVYLNIIKALRIIFAELEYLSSSHVQPDLVNVASTSSAPAPAFHNSHQTSQETDAIRIRLLPLLSLESLLAAELSGGVTVSRGKLGAFVRSGWQDRIVPPWKLKEDYEVNGTTTPRSSLSDKMRELTTHTTKTLSLAVDDIENLWMNEDVQRYLKRRQISLDDCSAYFLGNIQRIAEPEYTPTNDDILHVRLQTLGVMEHSFPVTLAGRSCRWKMYDVGGARGQRPKWIPYFEDATAIIFLAPVSAFDQYLEEDPKVNRVEDSLQLWNTVCSNQLLKGANLVLLLNKIDLLRDKLEAGVHVRKYITSYGDRPNNFETVADYFRGHFLQVYRKKGQVDRPLYVHFTSMLDVKATQSIISNVGEAIVRKHISRMGLL